MDIGVCVASRVTDIDYVVLAEQLGFTHAWMADSQMLWSDVYASLALAADRTNTIQIGTGVAVSGTRPAAVNAAGIATINALAPGRTFFGVGSGNTARRIMGLPPQKIAEFDDYLRTLVPLLRGEEALLKQGEDMLPIKHIMPKDGFVNFQDPIPLFVSGFGPKSLALAGTYGHGAVLGVASESAVRHSLNAVEEGAFASGRYQEIDGEIPAFYNTALTSITVLDSQEAIDSPRVKSECGAMAMAAVHYAFDQFRNFGHQPPNALAEIWDDYCAMLSREPADRVHQRIHAGHNCWVLPEEEKFLTPDVLQASNMIGTQDQLIERLLGLSSAGLNQVMVLPNFDTRKRVLKRISTDIIPHVKNF
jgi:alkanesulfonate monooxygenase SsuD/methylene tetrahydromethanopterin reductase-like flavin-dependent oxidoreductase (luciferase family)